MHLKSKLLVDYTFEQVTTFFYEPSSLAKWDKSVSEMIPTVTSTEPVGSTFTTFAPSGMRMNYEVIEMNSDRSVKIKLRNSPMFKNAIWHFQFIPVGQKTEINCDVYFLLRLRYLFLYPILFFNKSALLRDLRLLNEALEKNYKNQ